MMTVNADDVVSGAEDEEQAESLFLESKKILEEGAFNLRKFVTNSSGSEEVKEQRTTPPMVSHS